MSNELCSYCQQSSHVPLRSTWARAVLNKIESDRCLENIDRTKWYRLSRSDLLSENYYKRFIQLSEDDETKIFLKQSQDNADNVFIQIIYSLLTSLLTLFMTRTSANGLLGRGRMFVYSTSQFQTLLDTDTSYGNIPFSKLLDIGAADGSVTQRMSSLFKQTYVTEISPTMKWRLSTFGYTVLDTNDWSNLTFDVITCLNVLDRCEKPITLLQQIRKHLNPKIGRLILSLVLPFKPYFEYNHDHRPMESIVLHGDTPEEQINDFLSNIIEPLGFHLVKLTRLPYLCEGDIERSYYFLFDYIFVLEML